MRQAIIIILLFCSILSLRAAVNVTSPDGHLSVSVQNEGGRASYTVQYDGQTILQPSALGFKANVGDFTTRLQMTGQESKKVVDDYTLTNTKQRHFHYEANQLDLKFQNGEQWPFIVTFQVANNSVAFRYTIMQKGETRCIVVKEEVSGFNFPSQTTSFLTPQDEPLGGWQRTHPSYEEEYKFDEPVTSASQYGLGYTFPCLFRIPGQNNQNLWALVSETGVTSQYCGSRLSDYKNGTGYTIAFPMENENNGFGSTSASFGLPGSTPWRTITIGNSLKPIVESTVQFDVVKPLYEPSTDYAGGRATWAWIMWEDTSCNYDDFKTYIDFAHDMGYEYTLMDALWDQNIGRDRMSELISYARSRGVNSFLWYNSNGAENDAPGGPRNCLNTSIARKKEFKWLKQNGVKGLKVDFFGGDKQETMRLYEDILSDANECGIQLIFHGCTLPRGWERMYPNFCSAEAVLASENVMFNQHYADEQARNLSLHPFCRNAVASMDWGGTFLNTRINRTNDGKNYRKNGDIFELASAITIQSGVQNFAIAPNNMTDREKFVIDFMKHVPTQWQQTQFIDGYPGRFCILARQSLDGRWLVGGINAEKEAKTIELALPMFQPRQKVNYYYDLPRKKGELIPSPALKTIEISSQGTAKVVIQPRGGVILCQ